MDEIEALEAAFANTARLVDGVGGDQWTASTPCARWDVRDLVNHTIYVVKLFDAAARSGTPPEAEGDHVGDDAPAAFRAAAESTLAAWRGRRADLDAPIQLPNGERPGRLGININVLDTYVHGWDVATATGQAADLDPDLCGQLLDFARGILPAAPRDGENFTDVVGLPDSAPAADQLVAWLGRRP
jgi:uncharacterized protein (TIGR03086 family)